MSRPMHLFAQTDVVGSKCSVDIGVSEDELNSMDEHKQEQLINEFMGNVVEIYVAPGDES